MKKTIFILIILNVIRVALIPFIDVIPLSWSEYAANVNNTSNAQTIIGNLSYLTIALGANRHALNVLFVLIMLLNQWQIYILIKKIIRPERKHLAWLVICSTLFFTLFTWAPISDNLLMLFWTLSILTLYNAIFENDTKSWVLAGIFIGFSSLIKLSGIALPVGFLVFLIFSSRYRHHLFTAKPYLLLSITAIITIPLWSGRIIPESAAQAISYTNSIFDIIGIHLNSFTSFLVFQLLIIFPILYIGLWWVTFKYLARIYEKPNQVDPEFWFLLSFFLPLFIGFHLIALFDFVDFFGLIPIYLTGFIVLLKLMKKRWFYWSLGFSIVAHLVLVLGMLLSYIL